MRRCIPLLALSAAVGLTQPTVAQGTPADLNAELAAIREGGVLEARGDLAGAERITRALLEKNPRALTTLITLERLLTMQGRVIELAPYVDRLLASDPYSVIGHQMRVRLYATVNRPADLKRAADDWIRATPDVETPYREIARVWQQRGDIGEAAAVLEQGRARIGGTALALELGDVFAAQSDYARAAAEWGRAIGDDGQAFLPVQRRIQMLPDGGAAAIPSLVTRLRSNPTTWQRRRAAVQIALDAGLVADAAAIAQPLLKDMPSAERVRFLTDVGRRADQGRFDRMAYWAYGELLRLDNDTTRALAVRSRFAQLAMAVGDTARAAQLYRDLEKAAAPGSPQRRQALAARIQLEGTRGNAQKALADLAAFRTEFPNAPELDEAAARVGAALLEAGDLARAKTAVTGITGAHSGMLRGRIYLRNGDVDEARAQLLSSAPALHGAEATDALALAALVARLSRPGADLLARVLGAPPADGDAAAHMLLTESRTLAAGERAALLDYAALLADRADAVERAELLRREIIAEHGTSAEAPAALLALARAMLSRDGGAGDAGLLLERLILDHPKSALVPQARRQLDLMRGAVPGG
ncbi:MAG TPA: hypothetical protein VF035_05425 [Longimicrobiales bacterium]